MGNGSSSSSSHDEQQSNNLSVEKTEATETIIELKPGDSIESLDSSQSLSDFIFPEKDAETVPRQDAVREETVDEISDEIFLSLNEHSGEQDGVTRGSSRGIGGVQNLNNLHIGTNSTVNPSSQQPPLMLNSSSNLTLIEPLSRSNSGVMSRNGVPQQQSQNNKLSMNIPHPSPPQTIISPVHNSVNGTSISGRDVHSELNDFLKQMEMRQNGTSMHPELGSRRNRQGTPMHNLRRYTEASNVGSSSQDQQQAARRQEMILQREQQDQERAKRNDELELLRLQLQQPNKTALPPRGAFSINNNKPSPTTTTYNEDALSVLTQKYSSPLPPAKPAASNRPLNPAVERQSTYNRRHNAQTTSGLTSLSSHNKAQQELRSIERALQQDEEQDRALNSQLEETEQRIAALEREVAERRNRKKNM